MGFARTHPLTRAWRIFRVLFHFLWGVLLTVTLFLIVDEHGRQMSTMAWSAKLMRMLNLRLKISGELPDKATTTAMFVANHISWLDIWAINSIHPVRFVAKSDVRHWPVVGWLARKTGVIFIERERRRDTARVSELSAQVLRSGECLCVFPEGTTTEGEYMLPFRSSLLQAAVDTESLVWPVAVRYLLPDGKVNTAVAYAGETALWESVYAIASQQEISAELIFLRPIPAQKDRRVLTQLAEQAIRSTLHLPLPAALGISADPQDAGQ